VTSKFCGSPAAAEEGTMILVNSKDAVAGRIQDIQAQAAAARGRRPHGHRPHRGARRTLATLPGLRVLARAA
jgi:hypothetical protein